jgi:hypothetical protein
LGVADAFRLFGVARLTNINEVLDGHVMLEVEFVDGMLLNAYVPNLRVAGQVVRFLTDHLGNPVPPPASFSQIGNRFVREAKAFAARNSIPILRLAKPDRSRWDDRKVDHVRPYVDDAVTPRSPRTKVDKLYLSSTAYINFVFDKFI